MRPQIVAPALTLALVTASVSIAACAGGTDQPPAPVADGRAVIFTEAAWSPPGEADIPNDSMGASIKRGLYLLRFTPESLPDYATGDMRCTSCHQGDGIKVTAGPLTGSHARFPKYMPRSGTVIGLADRVNYCFTRSLAGNSLPVESREMTDILAYLAFISKDVPVGTKIEGADGLVSMKDTLDGDASRGAELYVSKTCVSCHMPDGQGQPGVFPPLWGPKSYSVGASMTREERAASFIYHNMPQTAPGTLTPQEAFDLAAFVNSHPRPDSPGKELDWPMGGAPKDVPYDTKGHAAYRPPPLLPRATPERALVPNPPVAGRSGR
jgi:thiosulfate dehydrogenase